jgi:hypothetical protein
MYRHWRLGQQSEATPVNVWAVHEATSRHTCGAEGQNGNIMFLASIYRFVCGYILCIGRKWNLSVWSYKMSGETFWSGVWFSHKKDFKMGCKNQNWKHRPVINVTYVYSCVFSILQQGYSDSVLMGHKWFLEYTCSEDSFWNDQQIAQYSNPLTFQSDVIILNNDHLWLNTMHLGSHSASDCQVVVGQHVSNPNIYLNKFEVKYFNCIEIIFILCTMFQCMKNWNISDTFWVLDANIYWNLHFVYHTNDKISV